MSYVHEVGDREVEGRVGYGEGKKGVCVGGGGMGRREMNETEQMGREGKGERSIEV